MTSESNWSSFLNFIEDLVNDCENHMSGEDYSKIEGLLERLHAARNGCESIVHALSSLSEIELDSENKFFKKIGNAKICLLVLAILLF